MIEVVVLGEALIDMIATEKNVGLFRAPSFEPKPGGAPANVAVGVRRLGRSSALVGRVGPDDFGHGLRQLLEAEGVDTSNLLTDPEQMTTMALVSLSDSGDPDFAIYMGASINLQPADLDHALIANADIFHFSSVSLAREPSRSATLEALRLAQANNVFCTYDVNWRPAIWPDAQAGLEIVRQPIPQIDLLKLSAEELHLIAGDIKGDSSGNGASDGDTRAALAALDIPAPLVVVTLGKDGCLYRYQGAIDQEAVAPVADVVDATGAGDAFMAALLAELALPLAPDTLPRLMRRACQAGAIAVTRRGAIPALPYPDDLSAYPV